MRKSRKTTENCLSFLSSTLQAYGLCPVFINLSWFCSSCAMSFVFMSLLPECTQIHFRVYDCYVGLPKRKHLLTKSRLQSYVLFFTAHSASHLTLQNLKLSPPQLLFKESDSPNKSELFGTKGIICSYCFPELTPEEKTPENIIRNPELIYINYRVQRKHR